MGSNTSTTIIEQQQAGEEERSLTKSRSMRQPSLKRSSSNTASDDEKSPIEEILMENQPSIIGFVGNLMGIKQSHHHKAIRVVDMEQAHKISESSILSSPLKSGNTNGGEEAFQPIYSSKTAFTRPRAKSFGPSLKNSLSSNNSVNSSISNSILTRNQVHLNSSYDGWNRDAICWEEFKRKSIERENKRKKVKDVSASWSPSPSSQSPNGKQPQATNNVSISVSLSTQSSPRGKGNNRRYGIILAPITNRVGMEVERTGIGNFLKNLEQPSLLSQSIK
ncbi:predicted protein [Naegleria gruberi]|uniref:Predicted protein n=1 Tax=Naegleria gruberi TaxID=5762 RepID=D2VYE7_NAEGR|nr:uncharacterized protein NAEGRDRAFT_53243 [Naegleria gruberi]EFC38196.1 predicted protein [Naegleria gruberi]|eukprot:XP_002670940.1 predicted protein [Naegleria gruberi strain NEG-M]